MIKDFTHPTLGHISVIQNQNARNIIVRVKPGRLVVTVSPKVTKKELDEVLKKHESDLQKKLSNRPIKWLNSSSTLESERFSVYVKLHDRSVFQLHLKHGRLTIYCPNQVDFEQPDTQQLLVNSILKALKYEAKQVLPPLVWACADKNNIQISQVKVNSSIGRWGSCSNRRNINLSYYCLLLPSHLLHYIILHELTHTFEMNHSERFYAKLDQLCGGKSNALQMEIKQYTSPLLELTKQYR